MTAGLTSLYRSVRSNLLQSANVMPEASYSFRPTPDVRSFAELVGHVTNTQYSFCAPVIGGKPPELTNFELEKSKPVLVQALQDALSYCDAAYDSATDATLGDPVSFQGLMTTKLHMLTYNIAHDNEHYGNIVTYLRLKGLVPPSTAKG